MKKIITVQHTQSEQHTNGMIGSCMDWKLTDLGVEQANSIGKRLKDEIGHEKYLLYSSDLQRTKQTAEIISDYLNIKPNFSSLLREFDLGEAVGKSKNWAKENGNCPLWPGTVDWAASADGRVFNGAETRREVWNRVSEFYKQFIVPSNENVIIVSHDGTLSIFYALWLGMSIDMLDRIHLSGKSGGVSFMYEDNAGNHILAKLNDMSYIKNQL